MKKAVQLLILSAVIILAARSNAGAYPTCPYSPPCNFVYDDCVTFRGNWSSEFINYCVDSNNQIRQWYSYSCFGRGVFQQGTCLD